MNEGDYFEPLKGRTGRIVGQGKLIKTFYGKEDVVLLALKGVDKKKFELPCGEGWGELKYTKVEVQISHSLSPEQQKVARAMLLRGKQVFSNQPEVAKGEVHRFVTGDARPQAVTPYRGWTYVAKPWGQKAKFVQDKRRGKPERKHARQYWEGRGVTYRRLNRLKRSVTAAMTSPACHW